MAIATGDQFVTELLDQAREHQPRPLPSAILVYQERKVVNGALLGIFSGHNFDLRNSVVPGDLLGSIATKLFQLCRRALAHAVNLGWRQCAVNETPVSDIPRHGITRPTAHRTIEETQIIRLSLEDQRAFAEAILNPPPPSPALVRAAEAHRRLIKQEP